MKDHDYEAVYCLSHAMTLGITRVLGEEGVLGYFWDVHGGHLNPNEWTRDPEEALMLAKLRQADRVRSLQNELCRALAKEFKVPE